jgi:ribosomal protein S18 acetylase RimI-like enzyme
MASAPGGLTIRRMTERDIPACQRLREQAGWNQTDDDWRRLLAWEPDGCFVAERGGQIVGSTTTTLYGTRLAWIGMVLVDEAYRRQGIARALFGHAMAYLAGRGVQTVALDSTPLAQPLYAQAGYADVSMLERRRGTLPALPPGDARPVTPDDLPALAAFDAAAFGAGRARILEALVRGCPEGCFVVGEGVDIGGYLLTRPGANAWHIGPLVARDADTAERLARTALQGHDGRPALMDVMMENPDAVALSERLNLATVRPFIRMMHGPPPTPDLARLYTSAGPEFG